jgi:hypothetical protein
MKVHLDEALPSYHAHTMGLDRPSEAEDDSLDSDALEIYL